MHVADVASRTPWADRLTISRICCAPALLIAAAGGATAPFIALALYGVLTDIIDGPVARAAASASARGAQLDSRADIVFYPAVLFGLVLLFPARFREEFGTLMLVLAAYGTPILIGWWKFGALTAYHTVLARIALCVVPTTAVLWLGTGATTPLHCAVALLVLSAVEEVLITMRLRAAQANIPHLFALPHANPSSHRTP